MVYGTDEQERLFAFRLSLDASGLAILLAPAAITVLWLRFASYAKRNWDLLMLYLGVLFCVFVLLAPPRPGYFVWSLPFLIHFMCRARAANGLLYFAYGAAYLLFFWLGRESDVFDAWRLVWSGAARAPTPDAWLAAHGVLAATLESLLFSAMEGTLACLIVSMYFVGVRSNEVYRQRATPVLIGIAGDSASGKRSFAGLVARVLGETKVTLISGDDYHRWPRGHEMYRVYTHLNAAANALHRQQEHAFALSRGKSVIKGIYDHRTGAFTEERLLDPGAYVVFTGLHALAIGQQRSIYDLRVFLDPDEALRRMWKVRRDCTERGYQATAVLETMQRREKDREAYILPQREHAEIVVKWSAPGGVDVAGPGPTPLVLDLTALNGFDLQPTVDALRHITPLTVDHEPFSDARWQALRLVGTISAAELRATAEEVVPNLREITPSPQFADDLAGCLQLVFLVCLSWKLRWRGEAPSPSHEPDGRG
jgi:uridine kinase